MNIAALRRLLWLWGLKMRNGTIAFSALRALRALRMVAALGGAFGVSCAVAAGLNDTGFTTCADASGATVSCTAATAVQGQDARYGRDAAAGTGALTKVGGGANGFDFSKVKNSGVIPESNNASLALGAGAEDWGCTYDNTTGLMWEVKTTSGLRSFINTYSWYSSNAANNGGGVGVSSGGNCGFAGRCDTEKFTQDVNAAGMCGHNDWRMPTLRELNGLMRFDSRIGGSQFLLDESYFPNRDQLYTWSGSPDANEPYYAWIVGFYYGFARTLSRVNANSVRLVRIGQ